MIPEVKLYFLIMVLIMLKARSISKSCDISGDDPATQCYTKEVLISMAHSPHQLSVDTEKNILYFSFDSGQGEYMPALFSLETKDLTVLKGVKDAFAISYDSTTKEVYFGGTHGIYKYSPNLKTLKRLNIKYLDVWWLFAKNGLYFIKFPTLNTYAYMNSSITNFPEITGNVIHQLVVDMDGNVHFINNTGLYGMRSHYNAFLIEDRQRFLNMATDKFGYVYVCSEDGLYTVSRIVKKVKKLANIHGVLGFTFDMFNNIIYSDSHEIVRLWPIHT